MALLATTGFAVTSHAVEVSILRLSSSVGTDPLQIGDIVSIDLSLSNNGANDEIAGVSITAHGYDESVADFVSGQAARSIFNTVIAPSGEPFGGLFNSAQVRAGNGLDSPDLGETSGLTGEREVEIFQAIGTTPATGTGVLDIGVGGIPVATGGAHARLTFILTGPGLTTLLIDSSEALGDTIVVIAPSGAIENEDAIGTSIDLFVGMVVPEPSTALLVSLGLGMLASHRPAGRRN